MLPQVPHAVFKYLSTVYQVSVEAKLKKGFESYEIKRTETLEQKTENLRKLRPNLANPANKTETEGLNSAEVSRSELYKELIDDVQLELLDAEQHAGLTYYTAMLNNMRALISLFDKVLYKNQFINLPGDEIVEKKHKNIKHLIAQERNEDLSRRETRKWPGLGNPIFKIDLTQLSPKMYPPGEDTAGELKVEQNELNAEAELQNTPHHK